LLGVWAVARLGLLYLIGVAGVAALLVYEHRLVRPADLSRINLAFFTLNGIASLLFMALTIADILRSKS
jgi:4-hydroxybenzoate polyprenyltransferase